MPSRNSSHCVREGTYIKPMQGRGVKVENLKVVYDITYDLQLPVVEAVENAVCIGRSHEPTAIQSINGNPVYPAIRFKFIMPSIDLKKVMITDNNAPVTRSYIEVTDLHTIVRAAAQNKHPRLYTSAVDLEVGQEIEYSQRAYVGTGEVTEIETTKHQQVTNIYSLTVASKDYAMAMKEPLEVKDTCIFPDPIRVNLEGRDFWEAFHESYVITMREIEEILGEAQFDPRSFIHNPPTEGDRAHYGIWSSDHAIYGNGIGNGTMEIQKRHRFHTIRDYSINVLWSQPI